MIQADHRDLGVAKALGCHEQGMAVYHHIALVDQDRQNLAKRPGAAHAGGNMLIAVLAQRPLVCLDGVDRQVLKRETLV